MPNGYRADLLVNASATGSSQIWPGGKGRFMVEGTFGGASINLEHSTANGTFVDAGSETTFTTDGSAEFFLPAGQVRAVVTGGGASNLFAYVVR